MNEMDSLALISLGSQISLNLWNNHWSEGKQKRIEPARKLQALHVPTGRYSNCNRIYGSSNSVTSIPTTVIIYMIPSFFTFSFDSCEGCGGRSRLRQGYCLVQSRTDNSCVITLSSLGY